MGQLQQLLILCALLLAALPFSVANLEITEVMPNPDGDDDAIAPEGEWVELHNSGFEAVNLSGYLLRDSQHHELPV